MEKFRTALDDNISSNSDRYRILSRLHMLGVWSLEDIRYEPLEGCIIPFNDPVFPNQIRQHENMIEYLDDRIDDESWRRINEELRSINELLAEASNHDSPLEEDTIEGLDESYRLRRELENMYNGHSSDPVAVTDSFRGFTNMDIYSTLRRSIPINHIIYSTHDLGSVIGERFSQTSRQECYISNDGSLLSMRSMMKMLMHVGERTNIRAWIGGNIHIDRELFGIHNRLHRHQRHIEHISVWEWPVDA